MQGLKSGFKISNFDTPLGKVLAIADEETLHLLEFVERRGLEKQVEGLDQNIVPGITEPILSIKDELKQYFEGNLREFNTPIVSHGTPFQIQVWEALQKIPPGETRSYLDIAVAIGKPTACRAVARANASNRLAIIIPCHRVINANGMLGGYAGGLIRKKWLLNHENNG